MSILQKTIQPPLVPSLNRFSYPNKLPGSHKEGLSFIGSFWKCKYELHILGFFFAILKRAIVILGK